MNQETFGVKIEAIIDGFKSKMNEAKQIGQNMADKIKQSWKKTDIKANVGIDEKNITRIAELRREISILKSEMREIQPGTQAFKEYAIALNDAEQELKQLTNSQNKAKNTTNQLGNSSNKAGNDMKKAFNKTRNSILRTALSLFSIRSIFSLVSKASSAYLSQDTDLAGKLESAWAGLGAFLAPIIESIANKILKLVKYMNVFIKAVTGQDLLAKASKKTTDRINAQNKAAKKLNKSLSDMDEITNIQDETSKTGVDKMENPFANFEDVKLNEGIVDFLTRLGKKVREIWDNHLLPFVKWVKDNWQWIALVAVGTAIVLVIVKLTKATKKIKDVGTAMKGIKADFTGFFDKLGTGLEVLAILGGVALVIKSISNLFKQFGESGLSVTEGLALIGGLLLEIAVGFTAVAGATKLLDLPSAIGAIAVFAGLALVLKVVADTLTTIASTGMNAKQVFTMLGSVMGVIATTMAIITGLALVLGSNPLALIAVLALAGAISLILITISKTIPIILDAVGTFIVRTAPLLIQVINAISDGIAKIINALGKNLPPIIRSVSSLFQSIFTTIKNAFNSAINFIIKGINVLIRGLNKIKIKTPDWIPGVGGKEIKFNLKEIATLDVGTNYVPEDQLAYIHKGEAVVPKKFNSAEYFSNINNNEETNALLMDVNRNLIELIDKDTNLYINGKEFAQATYKDFKNEENRLGTSSVVNVR